MSLDFITNDTEARAVIHAAQVETLEAQGMEADQAQALIETASPEPDLSKFILDAETVTDICERVLPAPDQVLSDFADRGDKMFIIGTSKSRKSFTALQIALHIVSGGRAGMPFEVGGAK